jgi:curved DNA-binding protein CbpA
MTNDFVNYYKVLGIEQDACWATIKNKFLAKIKVCHPDKITENTEARVKDEAIVTIEAWQVLRDLDRRREFDLLLEGNGIFFGFYRENRNEKRERSFLE